MEFYGLLGEKLSHSLSPKIHKLILDELNLEGAYKLFEVEREDLKDFSKGLKILKIKGVNVTIPYKQDIMEYLDSISKEALRIGAINTIELKESKLYGYNTDYYGFGYMLDAHNIDINEKVAVILGNGGATKAVLHYLLDNKISKVYIVSRNPKINNEFKEERVKLIGYEELDEINGDILINSTPVGMYPKVEASPIDSEIVDKFSILVDLIYNPMETKFLKYGRKLNKKTVGGLYMLVGQAVKAEEIWHGIKIEKEVINKIYNKLKC